MDKIYSCWLYIPLNAAMKLDLATGQWFGVMRDSERFGEVLPSVIFQPSQTQAQRVVIEIPHRVVST
jgi:hypothetical protein